MAAQQQGGKAKRGGSQAGHSKRGSKTPNTSTAHASSAVPTPSAQNGLNNGRSTPSQASGTASPVPTPTSAAPSAGQAASAVSITPETSKQMKDRMLYLLVALVGRTVTVNLKGGAIYSGILAATTTDAELGLALKRVTCISNPDEAPKKTLLILAKDLLQVTAAAINLEASTSAPPTANGKDTFRTDVDISNKEDSQAASGRQLRRWADEVEESEALEFSQPAFGRPTPAAPSSNNAWDQFATNEKLFGAKTNYNEEMYTTKLDRSGKDFREREKKAAALAQQILSGTTSNPHMAEERGQISYDNKGLDEEDKYSGVIRAPGSYVPPGARKTTENGSSTSPAPSPTSAAQPPADLPAKPSAETSAAAAATQANPEQGKDFLESFKQFVTGEKKRLQPKKAAATTKAKDDKLAEMIKFSQTFKLKTPVPADLLPYLTKDEQKQKDLLAGRNTNAEASTSKVSIASAGATVAASTSNTPQLKEAALASRVASPAAGKAAPPAQKKSALPEIPSFSELKALKAAKAANAAVTSKVEDWQARTSSPANPTKIVNPNAKAFNPNATAFNPGASPSPKPSNATPVPSTSQPAQQAAPQPHPFFGTKIIKKGAPSMHVKEDFSPFKRSDVPTASSVSPSWSYTGKPYKNIFIPAVAPSPADEHDIRRPPSSNASAPGMQLTPSQSAQLPPHHQLPPNMQPPPQMMGQGMPPQGYQMYYPPAPFRYNGPPVAGQYPPNSPGQPHMYQPPPQQYMNQMNFPPGAPQGMYSPQNMPPPQPGFINPSYRHPSYSGGPNMYNGQHTSPQPQHRQFDNTQQQPHQSYSRRSSGAQGPNMMMTQALPGAPMIPPQQK